MSAIRTGSPGRCEARSKMACSAYSPFTELCIGVEARNHLYLTRDCIPNYSFPRARRSKIRPFRFGSKFPVKKSWTEIVLDAAVFTPIGFGGARMMRFWSAAALALAAGQLMGQCGSLTGQPLDFTPWGDFGTYRTERVGVEFQSAGRHTALHVLAGPGRGQHSGFPYRHRAGRAELDSRRERHAVLRAGAGGSGGKHAIHHPSGSDRLHRQKRHTCGNGAFFTDRFQYSMDAFAGVRRANIFHSADRYRWHAAI